MVVMLLLATASASFKENVPSKSLDDAAEAPHLFELSAHADAATDNRKFSVRSVNESRPDGLVLDPHISTLWKPGEQPKATIVIAGGVRSHLVWLEELADDGYTIIIYWKQQDPQLKRVHPKWILIENKEGFHTECYVYLQHILFFYDLLSELTFFLQDDTSDEEYRSNSSHMTHQDHGHIKTFHATGIVDKIKNITHARKVPNYMPLSEWPLGYQNVVDKDAVASKGRIDTYGVDINGVPKLMTDLWLPGVEVPEDLFAWRNGLFVVSRQRLRERPRKTYAEAVEMLYSLPHAYQRSVWCWCYERFWQDLFGTCGFKWERCSGCGGDCGSCEINYDTAYTHPTRKTYITCA
jgi:hypothetical protein